MQTSVHNGFVSSKTDRTRRGPRSRGADTRADILDAARSEFAVRGYADASLRQVAGTAGVDPRLITHYFGSKANLFVEAFEFPFDPVEVVERVAGPGMAQIGQRMSMVIAAVLASERDYQVMAGLLRAAASNEQAARMARQLLVENLMLPLASRLGVDQPELRASMVGALMAGLVTARHILDLDPLVRADPAVIASLVAPVIEHYLTADIEPLAAS
jgi:AcrR family transcriptional regulator